MNNEMRPNLGRISLFMHIGSPQTKFVPSWDKFFFPFSAKFAAK